MSKEVTLLPDIRDRMADALKAGADAEEVEIRLEDIESTTISFQKDSLESLDKGTSAGGCVRALVNGSWGFSSFNSLDNLENRVAEAVSIAKVNSKSIIVLRLLLVRLFKIELFCHQELPDVFEYQASPTILNLGYS